MKKLLLLLFLCLPFGAIAGEDLSAKAAELVAEGQRLYRSEMASWYGTDLFFDMYQNKDKMGGYLSYAEGAYTKCIFYSRDEKPRVIWTISFDSTFNTKTANIDIIERDLSVSEFDLYQIRQAALAAMKTDTLFKVFENTNLNLIPLIRGEERKVYVLTGPKTEGVVVFGNDYLLTFNDKYAIQNKKRLHKNMIPIPYGNKGPEASAKETLHVHLPETGDFITATDICTLLLYERFTGWDTHSVVSKKYVSFWNCKSNELHIIPSETLQKINKDQDKSKQHSDRR